MAQESKFSLDYLEEQIKNKKCMADRIVQKATKFIKALKFDPLNIKMIKSLAFHGIPDEYRGLRSLCWKLILGYLSPDSSKWRSFVEENEKTYAHFADEFLTLKHPELLNDMEELYKRRRNFYDVQLQEFTERMQRKKNQFEEHKQRNQTKGTEEQDNPNNDYLNGFVEFTDSRPKKNKDEWHELFEDIELWDEVEKDTRRTRSELHFFVSPTGDKGTRYPMVFKRLAQLTRKSPSEYMNKSSESDKQEGSEVTCKNAENEAKAEDASKRSENEAKAEDSIKHSENGAKAEERWENEANNEGSSKHSESEAKEEDSKQEEEDSHCKEAANPTEEIKGDVVNEERNPVKEEIKNSELRKNSSGSDKSNRADSLGPTEDSELHHDVLSRILFIYAKLNPGIKYVQGMNEILAILYSCFANDPNDFFRRHAEVDAFFCFTLLMGEIKDGFIRNFDSTITGIRGRIVHLNELLKSIDPPLWKHLEKLNVNPNFYSLRWLMLLLTQEFELYDVMRLWDSLLAHPKKLIFLNYVCLAIMQNIRSDLFDEEFAVIMEKLQRLGPINLAKILFDGYALYCKHSGEERISTFVIL